MCLDYFAVAVAREASSASSFDNRYATLTWNPKPVTRTVTPLTNAKQSQVLTVVDKAPDGSVTRQELMHVGYVPLTRPSEMEDGYLRYS